ncbi:hypothetical protein BDR26DRAFT_45703 [Obelidium mucronatum]|nr:hypothetical protein BDR26DRAFT_45703 [Obelidium mucronatum]
MPTKAVSENPLSGLGYTASFVVPYGLAVVGIIVLTYLVGFIVLVDISARKQELSVRNIFAPANSLLIAMWLCFIGYYICCGQFSQSHDTSRPMLAGATFFADSLVSIFLWFSWLRSSDIIKNHASSKIVALVQVALYSNPIIGLIPCTALLAIPDHETSTMLYLISMTVCGALALTLDSFFMLVFRKNLIKMGAEFRRMSMQVSPRFEIISRNGFYASLSAIGIVVCYAVAGVCILVDFGSEANQIVVTVYHTFWGLKDVCIAVVGLWLVRMKIELAKVQGDLGGSSQSSISGRKESLQLSRSGSLRGIDTIHKVSSRTLPVEEMMGSTRSLNRKATSEGSNLAIARQPSKASLYLTPD